MASEDKKDVKYDSRDSDALPEDRYPTRGEEENVELRVDDEIEQDAEEESRLAFFMRLANSAFEKSTSYMETAVTKTWQDNLRHFRGEHASDSKYHGKSYRSRSRYFRPKTRSMIKSHEAAVAAALFTNQDIISLSAYDENDPIQAASSKLHQQLLQFRLENTIPWVETALGAYQDTDVYGVCISRQQWTYETWTDVDYDLAYDEETGELLVDEDGRPLGYEVRSDRVVKDEPEVVLIAPENFRFDPNADWRNPVDDSPYLIEQIPMIAGDVMAMMEKEDAKTGRPTWFKYDLSTILSAGAYSDGQNDTVRQAREGKSRPDPTDTHTGNEFSLVWVHLNIVRHYGRDYVFWTLGKNTPLTLPAPIEEVFPQGRPYRLGFSNLEAHRNYPAGAAEQVSDLQKFINEIANQRRDNVGLALNKRYFIKRQKQGAIDMAALMRNTPGGGVMVDDPEDVKIVETRDVTGSSYQEQDRASVEFDELVGNFSQSSVLSNRSLNETVGGLNIMGSGANAVQELAIRLFVISWVIPVLRDLVKLEALYETDEAVLRIAGNKAQIFEQGLSITPELLEQDLLVRVNVGMGHTNPAQKIEKLALALNTAMSLPNLAARLNEDEIGKEVFGYAGFADGERFLIPKDQLPEPQPDPKIAIEGRKLDLKEQEIADSSEFRAEEMEMKERIEMMRLALQEGLRLSEIEARLYGDELKDQTVRDMAAAREANKRREMALKRETGSGI